MSSLKERLDAALAEKGLFSSREKAKAAIMAGIVYVDGIRADKPGTPVHMESEFSVKEDACPYVSRGGLKLAKAIKEFNIDLSGAVCMDVGASTGGFTDCMLKNGAGAVYAVDVGYGQLDWKLRNDKRVVIMEKTNIRYLDPQAIEARFDFISIDVSFISLKLVFPVTAFLLKEEGNLVCLVKPQFEAGRGQVGKKGIVKDKDVHKEVLANVVCYGESNGLYLGGLTYSTVTGAKGNIEYLAHFTKTISENEKNVENIINIVVQSSHSEYYRL